MIWRSIRSSLQYIPTVPPLTASIQALRMVITLRVPNYQPRLLISLKAPKIHAWLLSAWYGPLLEMEYMLPIQAQQYKKEWYREEFSVNPLILILRSEERRVGKECVSTGRSGG